MKKYFISVVASMFIIGSLSAQEQKIAVKEAVKQEVKQVLGESKSDVVTLDEGYVKLEITEVSSEDEQTAQMLEMMKGSETEIYFTEGQSLTNMNMMGGMVGVKTHMGTEGQMNMYVDAMGNKIHTSATKMEMDRSKATSETPFDDIEFEYDMEDTKDIMGMTCYKVKSVDDEDSQIKLEAYVTEEIKTNATVQGIDVTKLKGFPLEFTISMGPVNMSITCMDLKKEVDPSVFELKADGYTEMSFEEFKQQMGGMMGM